MHKPVDLPGDWEKWLPPPPYDEMVRDFLRHARATLVWEDPSGPPMMACEDGGMIPLPLVRHDQARDFHAAEGPGGATFGGLRATRYSDVCTSIDRLEAIWADTEAISPEEWTEVNVLLEDVLYMIQRLARRHEAYDAARDRLGELAAALQHVDTPQTTRAPAGADDIRRLIENADGHLSADREALDGLAEQVRDVAQQHEDRAREKKELWLRIALLYDGVRGPRDWAEDEARVAGEEAQPQATGEG